MSLEILNIMKWIINNMKEIVENGIVITDVIEEPMEHYQSRTTYVLEYGEDDYGVIGIVADMGLSGSPSAWNHYRRRFKTGIKCREIQCACKRDYDA